MIQNASAIKIRELQTLTRALTMKTAQRRGLRKKLDRVEGEIKKLRRDLKIIVEDAASPADLPLCDECRHPVGSNALCTRCQALLSYIKGDAGVPHGC